MNDVPMNAPIWVARPVDLAQMVRDLAHQPILAVDTEANSLHAFREQVCLIQFSTFNSDYLLDPLALPDLSMLGPIFANPEIEKIFHAAEYDIIGMKRDFDFEFNNLFDTMVAGRILGRPAVGLASMLEAEFGIVLDKRYQRANWGQRPLPPALLAYARLDTHYLIGLRNSLKESLMASGRWPLAQEDFYRLTLTPAGPHNDTEEEGCWRVAGNQHLSPQQNAVLMELCNYRNRQAELADLPLFKVLSNTTLLQIAIYLPNSIEELYNIEDLSGRLIERHGQGLLSAVRRGMRAAPLSRPTHERPNDAYLLRLDQLRTWRKLTARNMEVESDVILPRDLLEAIALSNPHTLEQLAEIMRDIPWRFERFGEDILRTIRGQ
jgi:ribonuclease D